MRFKTYIFLFLLFSSQFYYSQTKYSTISDGTWTSLFVWDNGVPPNPLLEFDTIVIKHNVSYNLNQSVQGVIIVDTNGVLTTANSSDMFIGNNVNNKGELYNYGNISINSLRLEPNNCGVNDTKPVAHNFGDLIINDELNVGIGCGSGFFYNHYNSNFSINNVLHLDGYLCNEDTIFVSTLFKCHGGVVDCCGYIQTPEIQADDNDNAPSIFMCINVCTSTGSTPIISVGGSNYSFLPASDAVNLVVDNDSTLVCNVNQIGDSVSFSACNATFSYSSNSFCLDGANIVPDFIEDTLGYFSCSSVLQFVDSISGEINILSLDTGSYKIYHNLSNCVDSAQFSIYSSSFNYTSLSFCDGDSSALPIISGSNGGVFSTNLSSLLTFGNSLTGEIDILNSYDTIYSIYYDVYGCIDSSSFEIISDEFNYSSSSYCEGALNPTPIISGSSGGVFSSNFPISISNITGEIDLLNAIDTTYVIYYDYLFCRDSFLLDISSSSFNYLNTIYCDDDTSSIPVLNGTLGGIFSSSLDALISFQDTLTGEIDLSSSYDTIYTIYYDVMGCRDTFLIELYSNEFSFPSTSYCEGGLNPLPDIAGNLGGVFSNDLSLSIDPSSGEIDLLNAIDTSYVIYYDILSCSDSFQLEILSTSFNYDSSYYCVYDNNPVANVLGSLNGVFSSNSFIDIDSTNGLINLQNSLDTNCLIYYQIGNCIDSVSLQLINSAFNFIDTTFCIGDLVDTLVVEGINSGAFYVSPNDIAIDINTGLINTSGANNSTYIITHIIGGCESTFTINIDNPSFHYLDTIYCSSDMPDSATTVSNTNGYFSSTPLGVDFIDSISGYIDFSNSIDLNYDVIHSINNCSDTFNLNIVNLSSSVSLDDSICGLSTQIENAFDSEISYLWNPLNTGLVLSSDTVYNPTVVVSVQGWYSLECNVSKLGCAFNDTLSLKFADSIYLDLGSDLLVNQSFIDLSANSNADYFQWENISVNEAEIESPNERTTSISNLITGDYLFSITGSNEICPEKYDEIILQVDWIFIPNGFSPNGDGINDFFGLDGARNGVDFEIQIVNRWGELVYASSNAFYKWDGTINGTQIAEDTYFYFIELSNFQYKGSIDLRR